MNGIIKWKVEKRVGHLILNNPPTNKMTKGFFEKLKHIVNEEINLDKIKAIVMYGNGRHFSYGADLNDLVNTINSQTKYDRRGNIKKYPKFLIDNNKTMGFFRKLKIPVIAAVRGVCIGSALELALYCNIRLCGQNTVFGFPESTFNLMPGCGGTQNILKYTSVSKALEIMLQGNTFSAEDALKMKIVDRIFPKKEVIDTAIKLAKKIRD